MEEKIKEIIIKEFNSKVLEIKKITEGFSHHMYLVKIDKEPFELIIRFSNNTKGEFNLSKEKFVFETLAKNNIPVPKIYAYHFPKEKKDDGYMIIEKFSGIRLDTIWNSLTSTEKIQLTKEIGKLASKIHEIKLPDFGTIIEEGKIESDSHFKFKKQGEEIQYSHFLRNNLIKPFEDIARFLAYRKETPEFFSKLLHYISSNLNNADYSGKPTLIHGDFHTGHMFVEKTNGEYKITGLIDFEFAASYSPEYDFIKLHRQGFFSDSELKQALEEGYGRKINEKAVEFHRVLRDLGFAQVMLDAGNPREAERALENIKKVI